MAKKISMKIAVVVCDEPVLKDEFGTYPEMIKEFLVRSGYYAIEIQAFDLFRRGELPDDPRKYAGIIITGSKYSVNDDDGWICMLTRWIRVHWDDYCRVPLLGICFGHQIISRAFGAQVGRLDNWAFGYTEINVNEQVKLFKGRIVARIQSIHQEKVMSVPEGFLNIGSSENCAIQGLYSEARRILSFQGHPEVLSAYVIKLARTRHEQGIIDDITLRYVESNSDRQIDSDLFSGLVIRFFIEKPS